MTVIGIIGGTGCGQIPGLEIVNRKTVQTAYGDPSAEFILGRLLDKDVVFLARHGNPHSIPPHRINYRANIRALKDLGVSQIIAVAAVGGITEDMTPGKIVIPEQIIDYSYDREHSFFTDSQGGVTHIDFTYPYSQDLRDNLIARASTCVAGFVDRGTYACTQGPRLETAAEIRRLENDGCDIVGMTGMPEAALARELDIDYATCAIVANRAAGKENREISMADIEKNLTDGMQSVFTLLHAFCADT